MSSLATDELIIDIPARPRGSALGLSIEAGQVWGILGPNGVGKTTLLHTLAGLRKPAAGKVLLDGAELGTLSRSRIARKLGVVFQHNHDEFPASVWETVLTGRHPHARRDSSWLGSWRSGWRAESAEDLRIAAEALARLDLLQLRNRLTSTLSGGERQRVAVATVLAQQPGVWLVDEPTNHLDLRHQSRMLDLMSAQAAAGGAVVMCLHDLNIAARWCDHVMLMFDGGEACWGAASDMMVPEALTTLYQQPLGMTEIDGAKVFVPIRARQNAPNKSFSP